MLGRRWIWLGVLTLLLSLQPAVVFAQREIALDSIKKEQLNVFLSNFSEVLLQPFAKGEITDQELIRFGLLHTWANNHNCISRGTQIESIPADVVNFAVNKYFGLKIGYHQASTPDSSYRFTYQDGFYYRAPSFFPEFLGHKFAITIYFTQVTSLVDEGSGCYTVYGDMYAKEPQSIDFHSIYRPLSEWDNRMLQDIQMVRKVRASIMQIEETDGSSRYILLGYDYL